MAGREIWSKVFKRLPERLQDHHVLIISGGVAFYFFLSVFPALSAIISLYGLLTDFSDLQRQMALLSTLLPPEAQQIISERLKSLVGESEPTLGWQLILSLLISIWITNVGTRALFRGVNIAYGIENYRKFWQEIGITILFTIGSIVFYMIAAAVMVGTPALAKELGLPQLLQEALKWFKWPVLSVILAFALSLVYHLAPVGSNPAGRQVAWGAVLASLLWIGGSLILTVVVRTVGVAPSYGPLAAVAILLLWFLLTGFAILFGAEINSGLTQVRKEVEGK